jgi:RNAse (barnase) inhibitor barstar
VSEVSTLLGIDSSGGRSEIAETVSARAIEQAAARYGYFFAFIDGTAINGKSELLWAWAKALKFPDYFGRNWDALLDCLRDLSWLPVPGFVVVYSRPDVLRAADPETYNTLVETLDDAIGWWRSRGKPFMVAFVGHANS